MATVGKATEQSLARKLKTAAEYALKQRHYMLRVLIEMMPKWDMRQYPKNLEALLPWGAYIQEQFT